jgi:hypothetical protein
MSGRLRPAIARAPALLLGAGAGMLLLTGCAETRLSPLPAPPPAEFLVAAGDSAYWVRADSGGVRVRSAPLLLTVEGGRLHALRISEETTDYLEAEFVEEGLYAQPLAGGDSVLLRRDTLVARAHGAWRAAWPDDQPLAPDDDESLEPPDASATDYIEVIEVHGPWVSWAHAVDVDVPEAGEHVHRRQRGVADVRTGARATLDSLVSGTEAARLRTVGRATLDTLLEAVARAQDERARRAQPTLHTFTFDADAFTLTDVDRAPAVLFHVAGRTPSGEALEMLLPPLVLAERPAWWTSVVGTLPTWAPDSSRITWRHAGVQVVGVADADRTGMTLVLQSAVVEGADATEWPMATVPMPVYQVIALDGPAFPPEARAALRDAFDRAAAEDPTALRALAPHSRLPPEIALRTRAARAAVESRHVARVASGHASGHVLAATSMEGGGRMEAVAASRSGRRRPRSPGCHGEDAGSSSPGSGRTTSIPSRATCVFGNAVRASVLSRS